MAKQAHSTNIQSFDTVIVGSGHGGAEAAIALHQLKYSGSVALITREAHLPYERPPLSKNYMAGTAAFDDILIRPAGFWQEAGTEFFLNKDIVHIDPQAKQLTSGCGQVFGYTHLIWAAGTVPKHLPKTYGDVADIRAIRSVSDVQWIKSKLRDVKHICMIGGGYIGLEAAAVFRTLGMDVTILEAAERVLARVSAEPLSRFYEAEHRRRGVDIRLNARITSIQSNPASKSKIVLEGSGDICCDLIIAGVGASPCVAVLEHAGAQCSNGVDIDSFCRTTLHDVFAIGDCASQSSRYANNQSVRLESVQNARAQALCVARQLTGNSEKYDEVPWFWSDQYDLRLQIAGLSAGQDRFVVRGEPSSGAFFILYFRGDTLIAIDCVNRPKDFMQGRKLLLKNLKLPIADFANAALNLKSLALKTG